MKNLIDYFKDKIYYIMGGTVIVIILLVLISSCSSSGRSYESIEQKMVSAAKNYYASHEKSLPKEENGTVKVTINTLIEAELLKEVKDPKNKDQDCSGYVEVTKVGKEYSYTPFLVCKGNYEPKYLTDIVKQSKQDEYGNSVYEMGGEYVYRGDDVKNYVSFNNQLWRIVKVDSEGDIKLVLAKSDRNKVYSWDDAYNATVEKSYGVTTDYLHANIRKVLNEYYKSNFDKDAKAKIVSKNLCIGKYSVSDDFSDDFSSEKECSLIKENEKIGLLTANDYHLASLDSSCSKLLDEDCINRNYLSNEDGISTWLLNSTSETTYKALFLSESISESYANEKRFINPVINLNDRIIIVNGKGSENNPYIVK